ncbi:MAG: phage head morphogenesis protein [Ignavibacteriales bacterium]|nr:phage head morphogenesis protein [Ignavibacteriales bacterium]
MDTQSLKYLLTLPPEQIVRWYQSKGYAFSWNWQDVWQEAHAKSFTVAKAMRLDILQEIKEEVDKIFSQGITYEQFKKDLEPILKHLGWWGKVKASDVPGYGTASGIDPNKIVQLGSPYRLKTIYQTNANVAYSAGRYKMMIQNVNERPYWLYHQIDRKNKRKIHSRYAGKVFIWNDPIWDMIFPPNGFGCGCWVEALTKEEVQSRGLKVWKGSDVIIDVAEGWEYNPGKTALWDTNGSLPPCSSTINFSSSDEKKCIKIISTKIWKDFNRPDIRNLPQEYFQPAPLLLEPGHDKEEALRIIISALGISNEKKILSVKTPIETVLIKQDYLSHLVEKRLDQRERFANFIIPTLKNPFEIYLTEYEDGFRRQYIGLFESKYNILTVARFNDDGSLLFWNMMHADKTKMNKNRIGELIWYK